MTDSSESLPVARGQILADKYRVDEALGAGGMGFVVAATHLQLGKRVAIKMMLPSALVIPLAVERFEREARAAVQLRGEHVAQVLDVGKLPDGVPYLVLEFLDGADLGTVLESRGALTVDDAVDFVLQACEGVAEAHAAGIVHRDLKPRNLFLTHRVDGSALIKVLDFGISKWAKTSPEDYGLTRTGDVVGSPNYMSPEQIKSAKNVDARTDIWSLGVILFELLSGRVPFVATSLPQLCAMVLQDPAPPLSTLSSGIPARLSQVVGKCLEKDPDKRFASVFALSEALAPFAP
jgi:serine/threonine-protein kinase